jgi:competence protein ComEC
MLPVNGELASFGIQMAGGGLSHALQVLHMLAAFDGAAIETFVPTFLEIACYYSLLGLIVMRRVVKPRRWILLCVLAVLVADGLYWGHERFWHSDLRVTVIDVGQGSAALVEFPGGKTMLIDGGGYTNNRFFDVGERILAPFLRYRKIMQIDTIALSHPSSDHMNGLVYILAHFQPKKLLWTGDRAATESFRVFYQEVVRSGVQVPAFVQMKREMLSGIVKIDLLHPPTDSVKKNHSLAGDEYNNHSIVLKLTMGSCSILFPGDVERRAEEELVGCCRSKLPSRVLVAPHHGSQTSSSIDFLTAVNPEIIVISAGWQNRFGFPHACVLDRYKSLAAKVYRTDFNGAIRLRTDGRQWLVETQ